MGLLFRVVVIHTYLFDVVDIYDFYVQNTFDCIVSCVDVDIIGTSCMLFWLSYIIFQYLACLYISLAIILLGACFNPVYKVIVVLSIFQYIGYIGLFYCFQIYTFCFFVVLFFAFLFNLLMFKGFFKLSFYCESSRSIYRVVLFFVLSLGFL